MTPDPLDEVYEKFKHLDTALSDTAWCKKDDADEGAFIHWIAGEMWRAIKEAREMRK